MFVFRFISTALILLLLTACGNGSSSITIIYPPSEPSVDPNTSPRVLGNFSNAVKAEKTSDFVFELTDAEGDEMNVIIHEPPEWLTYEADQEHLQVTVAPGFFDIGNYRFPLTIDDGDLTRSYTLEFAVQDNPDAYRTQAVDVDSLTGNWELKSGHIFHLFESGKGLYVDPQAKEFQLRWSVDRRNSVLFELYPLACFECGKVREIQMQVVAQEDELQRWLLTDANGDSASNTLPAATPVFENGVYLPLTAAAGVLSEVNVDEGKLQLSGVIEFNHSELDVTFTGRLDDAGASVSFTDEQGNQPSIIENYILNFFDQVNGIPLGLRFDFYAHDMQVSQSNEHFLIVNAAIKPRLAERNANISIDDFIGLQTFLDTPIETSFFYRKLTMADGAIFQAGKTYFSRFSGMVEASINNLAVNINGASQLLLDENDSARLVYQLAGDASVSIEQTLSWDLSASQLTLTNDAESMTYQLYQNASGELFLAGYPADNNIMLYPLIEFDPSETFPAVLDGKYLHSTFREFTTEESNYLHIDDDRLSYFTSNINVAWSDRFRINADSSIDIIAGGGLCGSYSVNYAQCLSFHEQNFQDRLVYRYFMRRMQLVKVENNKYYFTYHVTEVDDQPIASGSMRVFYKVTE